MSQTLFVMLLECGRYRARRVPVAAPLVSISIAQTALLLDCDDV